MGNYIKPLSAGVALIASDSTWIEGKAIQQLQTTAELDGMCRVVGLPDLHPGRGYPVGAAFFSVGRFYPALVSNDIGCGMALWETGLAPGKLSADKLEKRLGNLDLPLDETWSDCIEALDLPAREHWRALGTIGGGNHFAELQQVETVFDQAALHALGLDAGRLQLLVHSGSARSRPGDPARTGQPAWPRRPCSTAAWKLPPTLARHADALRFAERNRQLIARRILERLRCDGLELLDINHNLVAPAQVDGVDGWLHRRAPPRPTQGVLVIPRLARRVQLPGGACADARRALFSLAHGAGRKWQRGECRERLAARFSVDQLGRTRLGSRVICGDRQLIYEEAPEACKGIDSVVGAVARSRPAAPGRPPEAGADLQTRGECCR
ncbi:RNA ligase RtcB family protein [Pseudomonas aeruginosa]